MNWSGQLYPDLAFAKSKTGSTRSCTKRGFSCPVSIKDRDGIAHATIVITDDAVVSYTTFSPFLGFFLAKKPGCMFSVILSVPAGCCLRDPRFLRPKRTREAPCLVVFGLSSLSCITRIGRLPDAPASASGPNVQPSQQHFAKSTTSFPNWKLIRLNVFSYQCRDSPIGLLHDSLLVVHV